MLAPNLTSGLMTVYRWQQAQGLIDADLPMCDRTEKRDPRLRWCGLELVRHLSQHHRQLRAP